MEYFIGLMSGTSLDGVDAVLAHFENEHPTVLAEYFVAYPPDLRQALYDLQDIGIDELKRCALVANQLAQLYASAITGVLARSQLSAEAICAVGCHGQTIRHAPALGYSWQIGNLALLAELSGLDIIGDFRSRDIAAAGQGAPLVPAFHQAVFSHPRHTRLIVNIGGISNLSILRPGQGVIGFDCGPGNMLLDAWCLCHTGQPYDRDGQWAARGKPHAKLLARLLADPYFSAAPPKSTGRDLFNLAWLDAQLKTQPSAPTPQDVQATLLTLSVESIALSIEKYARDSHEIYLCGGGAHNGALMQALTQRLTPRRIARTEILGLPAQQVEATAFAWLACQWIKRQPGNLPQVTGAQGPRILGALYPGR